MDLRRSSENGTTLPRPSCNAALRWLRWILTTRAEDAAAGAYLLLPAATRHPVRRRSPPGHCRMIERDGRGPPCFIASRFRRCLCALPSRPHRKPDPTAPNDDWRHSAAENSLAPILGPREMLLLKCLTMMVSTVQS